MKTKVFTMMMVLAVALLMASCNGNGKTSTKETPETETTTESSMEQKPEVELAFEDVAGAYYTYDDEGNEESVFYLGTDGTASWNMIGSLTISEYNYTLSGNKIILTADYFDEGETAIYLYNAEDGTITNEQGTVYYGN